MPRNPDLVVTSVAALLVEATGANATRVPAWPSVAAAPLVSGEATTGVLAFVRFGARKWKQGEISTLEAVAALFAQLQARIAAEEKLRYLAEHDDLTGLGHAAGDWFIKVFAQRMRVCAGDGMIARLGGDEFVIIPERPMVAATAEAFARRLVTMLRERMTIGGHVITPSVSIRVTVGVPGRVADREALSAGAI